MKRSLLTLYMQGLHNLIANLCFPLCKILNARDKGMLERRSYDTHPKYLGVILDRTLSYSAHIQSTATKVRARNILLRRLAGSN